MDKKQILKSITARHDEFYRTVPNASLTAMALMFLSETEVLPVVIEDMSDTEAVAQAIRKMTKELNAVAVAFMSEAWAVVGSINDIDLSIPASKSDRRIETVSTVVSDRKGSISSLQRIDRDFETGQVTGLTTIHEMGEDDYVEGKLSRLFD